METATRRRLFAAPRSDDSIGARLEALHRMTEIACFEHAKELGFGDDVIRPQGWMWLIAKTEVELTRPWDDVGDIHVDTRPVFGSATGLLWMVEVSDASGLRARQSYHWVLADRTSGAPIRLPKGLNGDRSAFKALETELYAWSEERPQPPLFVKTRWIDPDDLDANDHVHNTCHVRYAFDALDRFGMRYAVRYLAPLPAGRTLTLQASCDHGFILIEGFSESHAATPAFYVGVRVEQ